MEPGKGKVSTASDSPGWRSFMRDQAFPPKWSSVSRVSRVGSVVWTVNSSASVSSISCCATCTRSLTSTLLGDPDPVPPGSVPSLRGATPCHAMRGPLVAPGSSGPTTPAANAATTVTPGSARRFRALADVRPASLGPTSVRAMTTTRVPWRSACDVNRNASANPAIPANSTARPVEVPSVPVNTTTSNAGTRARTAGSPTSAYSTSEASATAPAAHAVPSTSPGASTTGAILSEKIDQAVPSWRSATCQVEPSGKRKVNVWPSMIASGSTNPTSSASAQPRAPTAIGRAEPA